MTSPGDLVGFIWAIMSLSCCREVGKKLVNSLIGSTGVIRSLIADLILSSASWHLGNLVHLALFPSVGCFFCLTWEIVHYLACEIVYCPYGHALAILFIVWSAFLNSSLYVSCNLCELPPLDSSSWFSCFWWLFRFLLLPLYLHCALELGICFTALK